MKELIYETAMDRYPPRRKGYRARQTAKKRRVKTKGVGAVREYVFARERAVCRCCRKRRADSMHEIVFRSAGGKVSKRNSIAACGDGVQGCHGFMQRHEILVYDFDLGAEGTLIFIPTNERATEWLGLKQGMHIESPVMLEMETAE